jgi:hypothetical protein
LAACELLTIFQIVFLLQNKFGKRPQNSSSS